MMSKVEGDRRRRWSTGSSSPETNGGCRYLRGYGIQGKKLDVAWKSSFCSKNI